MLYITAFPRKRKSKKFGLSIKKKLDKSINCIRLHDPRVSLPYGDPNIAISRDTNDADSTDEESKPRMFQVPSIHIIEPTDIIYESEEDELDDEDCDGDCLSDDEIDDDKSN